jgi:hypothetical protein
MSRLQIQISTIIGAVLATLLTGDVITSIVFVLGAGVALALHWWFNRSTTE